MSRRFATLRDERRQGTSLARIGPSTGPLPNETSEENIT